jgi:15-cis-phytoene synthase
MTDSGFSAFRAPQHTPTAEVTNEAARKRLAIDIAECRSMLRENSKTFFAASLLLPKSVREPASALYAFCRMADDAVDLAPVATKAAKLAAVEMLEERLERVYAGRPLNHAPDRAFAGVVAAFDIPRAVPNALIEGFLWDAEERRYASLDDLNAYATRVAGTVGAMMSILMRTRDADALARACDLGVAMQLSNIARDIGEDARMGRIYLPLDWLRDEGIDADEWLAAPQHSAALGRVVKRLLDEAATLYGRGRRGSAAEIMSTRHQCRAIFVLRNRRRGRACRNGFGHASRRRAGQRKSQNPH